METTDYANTFTDLVYVYGSQQPFYKHGHSNQYNEQTDPLSHTQESPSQKD